MNTRIWLEHDQVARGLLKMVRSWRKWQLSNYTVLLFFFCLQFTVQITCCVQVSDEALRSELLKESAALCLLGRLDPETLSVEGIGSPPDGQTVHLVIQVRCRGEESRPKLLHLVWWQISPLAHYIRSIPSKEMVYCCDWTFAFGYNDKWHVVLTLVLVKAKSVASI